jgi:hypothetical protein
MTARVRVGCRTFLIQPFPSRFANISKSAKLMISTPAQ